MTLRDLAPDVCQCTSKDSEVTYVRRRKGGFTTRRHRCRVCGHRWNSYETRINPRRLTLKPPPAPPATDH